MGNNIFGLDDKANIKASIYLQGIQKILQANNGLTDKSKNMIINFTNKFDVEIIEG